MNVDEICEKLGCDSLGFISVEGLLKVVPKTLGYCTACFSGEYSAGKPANFKKNVLEDGGDTLVK
jgi:amidophosphoribosyltransferase